MIYSEDLIALLVIATWIIFLFINSKIANAKGGVPGQLTISMLLGPVIGYLYVLAMPAKSLREGKAKPS